MNITILLKIWICLCERILFIKKINTFTFPAHLSVNKIILCLGMQTRPDPVNLNIKTIIGVYNNS